MKVKYFYRPKYFFIAFIVLSCKNNQGLQTEKKAPIEVKAAAVQEVHIKEYLTFNGLTQFQKKENIRANITGYISGMNYHIGDHINAGQVFAYVRTKEQDALKEAIKIDSSLSKFIKPLAIHSNVTGIITALGIARNEYIAEGDILATVVQPKSLVVQVNVPFEYEDYITIGTPCDILLQNGESLASKITGVLPTIDPIAQSQTFLIALPSADLPENLNVQIKTVYRQDAKAMGVPHEAVQTNELLTEYWVMKVVHDSLAIKQKVTPLLRNDSLVQIASEFIKPNDRVVTEGAYEMQDSTLVSILNQ